MLAVSVFTYECDEHNQLSRCLYIASIATYYTHTRLSYMSSRSGSKEFTV